MAAPNRPLWLDVNDSPYSNNGNQVASIFFLAIVAASLTCCLAVSWKTRRFVPFSLVLSITCIFEVTAYALRLQDWYIVTYTTNFGLSVIAPVFLTIGIHLCAAQVLRVLGTEHAVLSPNAHMRVFIWSDILAGLLQAIGLGLTFSRAKQAGPWGITLPKEAGTGQAIIYAGLLMQTLMLAVALVLLAIAYVRAGKADRQYGYTTFHKDGAGYVPLTPRFKTFLVVLPLAGVCVLVRCAYRSAAAWGGIGSPTARDQLLWLVAEGVMLTEAIVTLAAFHPAIWLDDGMRGRVHGDVTEQDGTRTSKLGKRLTVGTFATGMTDLEHGNARDSRQDLGEISQVIFSSNMMAPSDVSSEGSPSRRGSAGEHGHEPITSHTADMMASSPYDPHLPPARRYSQDITAESRALSPLEAEEEADRVSIIPEPPRKSSKRISRALEMARLEQEKRDQEEEDDRLEVESVVLPPRMPSKREPNRGYSYSREDDLEDVALTSTYSQSLYSQ
ncbi:hypothetical protein KVR01_004965 [Diaporthe batatas]|uniref:uncharacterized protein n=1 Tax=Diaporthe batatas TaxID=748121 RepID=UPI001D04A43E|nr:uncharacterized protein KVR01_004965 [Diaporthe batatas]KAG8164690.1 hypothetical protein KVR01_004965 [Diaporthe batatas]